MKMGFFSSKVIKKEVIRSKKRQSTLENKKSQPKDYSIMIKRQNTRAASLQIAKTIN
jgi:hypothetical protein